MVESLIKSKIDAKEYTYETMADHLGISKATLYTRLAKNNWKKGEIALALKLR